MNRRERNRAERRQRVLEAARELIADGGIDALTMRALAEEAGLAVNTVYALFGRSRDDILKTILEAGVAELDRMLHEKEFEDPLAVGPTLASTVVDYLIEREDVFRPVFLAEAHAPHREDAGWGAVQALAMGREALAAAAKEGLLRDDVDLEVLSEHVFQNFRSWSRRWAAREIEGAELRARVVYGVWLSLAAVATDETRPAILAAMRQVERELAPGRRGRRRARARSRR